MIDRLRTLDLNLLKVFVAICEEGSVTGAAERLGLAQSSVSHALTRLRAALQDPLFERTTSGMEPTAYALSLIDPVAETLRALGRALEEGQSFDPATAQRRFTIITTDLGENSLLPRLLPYFARVAPGVSLSIKQRRRGDYREALQSGEADLALGQLPQNHADFLQQVLLRDRLVYATRRDAPLPHSPSRDDLFQVPHVIVPDAMIEVLVRRALGRHARRRKIVAETSHYLSVPPILLETNFVSVLPASLVQRWPDLRTVEPPFKIAPSEVRLFWHRLSDGDQGCKWLRATIMSLFRTSRAADLT